MSDGVAPRSTLASLAPYRPGRSVPGSVKLASNESPFPPLPSVRRAIADAAALNRYPDITAASLRARLAEAHGVPTECVVVGAGSVSLLWQIAAAYLDPGDVVVSPWPSFEAYPIMAALAGARFERVPLDGWTADIDAVLRVAEREEHAKVVLLAEPNNPTGTAVGAAAVRRLVGGAPAQALVVVDQAYHEFNGRADDDVLRDAACAHANVAVLRTFSKAHGLAALRVGYMVAHPDIATAVQSVAVPFSVNHLGVVAAAASLDEHDALAERVAAVCAERDRLTAALRSRGHEVPDSEANFVWLPLGDDAVAVAERLEAAGVVTRPFPGTGIRVTIGTTEENDLLLQALTKEDHR